MTDLGDLDRDDLDRGDLDRDDADRDDADGAPAPDNQRMVRIVALAASVAIVALGLGAWRWLSGGGAEESAPEETVAEAPAPEAVEIEPEPVEVEPEPVAVPELDDSDSFVGAAVGALSAHPGLAAWLAGERMVRRFVVAVDNVANGRNPAQHLPFMRPAERFSTAGGAAQARISAASYGRYDLHAEIVASLDIDGIGRLYGLLEPLLDAAYAELGYPDTPFRGALERAIDHLLDAPVLDEAPAVTQGMVFHEYASGRLDALSPAQKQFIGMGPGNVRTVQAKMRAIRDAIGAPPAR